MRIGFIKQLVEIVEKSEIGEIEISRFGTRIRISKNFKNIRVRREENVPQRITEEKEPVTQTEEQIREEKPAREENLHTIKSPMVGTFYSAPSPDAPPYVEEGDRIKKGDVVCIIEAMKIMNEIESDVSGEVVEIIVSNEDPVEYNQGLFVIRKS